MYTFPEDRLPPQIVYNIFPACIALADSFPTSSTLKRSKYAWGSEWWLTQAALMLSIDLEKIMPRKAKEAQNGNAKRQSEPVSWVNLPLPDHADLEITEQWPDDLSVITDMVSACHSGWNFSLKRDDRSDGFTCFVIGEHADPPCKNVGMAGRADEPIDALRVALYRITLYIANPTLPGDASTKRKFR